MNHLYPNFFITHEREGKWHPVEMGRSIEKCLSGTCSRHCLLAARGDSARLGKGESARGDQHSTGGEQAGGEQANVKPQYCAWLVPLEGEPLGHFQMVEGGVGEIGRVYNPYVFRSHLPSAQIDHPLARAFSPAKHALLSEFYRRGNKASCHYAKDEPPWEDELGAAERDAAMAIARANPDWLPVFKELGVNFLWSFSTLFEAQSRACAELEPSPGKEQSTRRAVLLSPSAQARATATADLRSCEKGDAK